MATTRLRDALAEVLPVADSTGNLQMSDVIGNKTDTIAGNSITSLVKSIIMDRHSSSKVYPTLANGVTVTSGAGAWELGEVVEIMPTGATTKSFSLHWLNIEDVSENDVYEIVLYNTTIPPGAPPEEWVLVEICRERFSKISNQTGVPSSPLRCPVQAAGTIISAKLACKLGSGCTATVSISYHLE